MALKRSAVCVVLHSAPSPGMLSLTRLPPFWEQGGFQSGTALTNRVLSAHYIQSSCVSDLPLTTPAWSEDLLNAISIAHAFRSLIGVRPSGGDRWWSRGMSRSTPPRTCSSFRYRPSSTQLWRRRANTSCTSTPRATNRTTCGKGSSGAHRNTRCGLTSPRCLDRRREQGVDRPRAPVHSGELARRGVRVSCVKKTGCVGHGSTM